MNNINEEYENNADMDIKILVQETTMAINHLKDNTFQLAKYANSDEIKRFETITIKTESTLAEISNVEDKIFVGAQFTENITNIKDEYENDDCTDDKVFVCKTTINVNDIEVKEYIKDEIDCEEDKKFESCNHSDGRYQSYCTKCRMLVHILDRYTFSNTENRAIDEIPKDILEIRWSLGHCGIFTLKIIPRGVCFGPFTGLKASNCSWKIKSGRFLVSANKLQLLNWMQYINPAPSIFEQNLLVFQHENNLYYRSTREIREGEELFVYYGEEYDGSLNNNVKVNFFPIIESDIEEVFACTFCCLGFSSKLHLIKHNADCPHEKDRNSSNGELIQCLYCKIYLDLQAYLEYHESYCCKRYARNCVVSTPNDQAIVLNKRKKPQRETYKCSQCKYRTTYRSDLKDHTNEHFKVKAYRCKICARRFQRKESLKFHATYIHVNIDENVGRNLKCLYANWEEKPFKCSKCEYATHYRGCLRKHIAGHGSAKLFKCSKCDYVTKRKTNLVRHLDTHVTVKRFKCSKCDHTTHSKFCLKKHLDTHETFKRFKCSQCDYVTNRKCNLKRHFDTHKTVKRFKCLKCDYKTHSKYSLKTHFYTHETVKRFQCPECDYTTCEKRNLKAHSRIHKEVKQFVCSKCDYVTYDKRYLKSHSYTHETVKRFKCSKCEYATHSNYHFKEHAYKHENDKRFKCSECDYATYRERYLKAHYYKHQTVKRFGCSKCEFKTNYKWCLKAHACKQSTIK